MSTFADTHGSAQNNFRTPLYVEGQSHPARPRTGNRMVSSVTPQRRAKSTSRTRPGTMFPTFGKTPPRGEWLVFEQRMENEGQMRTKNTLRESVREGAIPSLFDPTARTAPRSESPVPSAPSPRCVPVEGVQESDDASTIGYDSESDLEDSSRPSTPIPLSQKQRWPEKWKLPSLSPLQRRILKCAVAYFVGSLFTFNSTFSALITSAIPTGDEGTPSRSGHMVATV